MAVLTTPVSSSGNAQKKCWNPDCSHQNSATKRCSKCRQAMYCGVECQRAHWNQHKIVCKLPTQPDNKSEDRSPVLPTNPGPGFQIFKQLCLESGSPMALSEARKYASQDQLNEAADFISLMVPADQDIFLKEMTQNSKWKTVDVAIKLGLAGRMKEAMEIMEGFPLASDRQRFLAGVSYVTGSLFNRYKQVISIKT